MYDIYQVCDHSNEIYFLGDLNIDWNSLHCPLKNRLLSITDACGLTEVVTIPTRVHLKRHGSKISACMDHIFTNSAELCTKAISVPIGCSDHNLIAIVRKTKVPKAGPKIIVKRSYKHFHEDRFIKDVRNICWDSVLMKDDPNDAVEAFNKLFEVIINKHAPVKKKTVRNVRALWIDKELK